MTSPSPHPLGEEWVPGSDGIPFRRGARAMLIDDAGSLLLVEGHDPDDITHRWWFTVGGGIAPGEDPRGAAVREVAEETGLVVTAADLVGPVAWRRATFRFAQRVVRQDEDFFVCRVPGVRPDVVDHGWTEVERELLDQHRWFSPDELDALLNQGDTVYPEGLNLLLRQVHPAWDGQVRTLTEQTPE